MQLALEEDKRLRRLTGTSEHRTAEERKQKSARQSRPGVLDSLSDVISGSFHSLFKDGGDNSE